MSQLPAKILIVDDELANVEIVGRLMRRLGYGVVTAMDGDMALEVVGHEQPDLVLLDVSMPKRDGFSVCHAIKQNPLTRFVPVVLVTGLTSTEDRVKGIDAGADDFLSKPVSPTELGARVRALLRVKRYTDALDSAEAVLMSLALAIEARDPYTRGHCDRLARYSKAFGRHLGLDLDTCDTLNRGGILHDVGKVCIPDAILFKPGPLTPEELSLMQRHTVIGDMLCSELKSLQDVRPIIRHHHERFDGGGYPDHLVGDQIPLVAQIVSIVDGFDAMTTDRPYQLAKSRDAAFDELRAEAGLGLRHPALVESFIAMMLGDEPVTGAMRSQP